MCLSRGALSCVDVFVWNKRWSTKIGQEQNSTRNEKKKEIEIGYPTKKTLVPMEEMEREREREMKKRWKEGEEWNRRREENERGRG